MKKKLATLILLVVYVIGANAAKNNDSIAKMYPTILNIAYTPTNIQSECKGLFADLGSWMGFTPPSSKDYVNGFCGPFKIDGRNWISKSIANVGVEKNGTKVDANHFTLDSTSYIPGELFICSHYKGIKIVQQLNFVDKNHAIIKLSSNKVKWNVHSSIWLSDCTLKHENNRIVIKLAGGEIITVSFPEDFNLTVKGKSYNARSANSSNSAFVMIGFYNDDLQMIESASAARAILKNPFNYIVKSQDRWNGYLTKVIRKDMPEDYSRIAVKSVVTLMANWRSAKGDLLHEGVTPSYAVFFGYWAWDSWKHAAVLAHFAPELAKNQIRAMFDYQTPDGMITDCVFTDKKKNNNLDSKPPLAAWAVMEIYKQTKDLEFVKEMYPKLLKYNRWWYINRDHDKNGICEYGSTIKDTLAAKWESGMDNAVRFDSAQIAKNNETAWSLNQESVDLNSFLFFENKILKEMAVLINSPYPSVFDQNVIDNYFFDPSKGYYYDRKINGGFISIEGCEGFIPLWTKMASEKNAAATLLMYENPNKFSSYIPFPSLSIDNPKNAKDGYWRGPVWLDQVYFGISGLRNYGYKQQADKFTEQVFERLNGLKGSAPIYENYDPHTGVGYRAPHFGWSAAHLLMLYWEYKK